MPKFFFMYALSWISLTILVSIAGSYRRMGFFTTFLLALFFSPLVGLIGVALSKRLSDELPKTKMNEEEEKREYFRLKRLKETGLLTEEEFLHRRNSLFDSNRG